MAEGDNNLVGEVVGGSGLDDEFARFIKTAQFSAAIESLYPSLVPQASKNDTPVGAIMPYGGNASAPSGWLYCDGGTFDSKLYAELYAILGTDVVPNLKGRVIVGVGQGSGLTNRAYGASGGIENAIVVSHDHGGLTGSMNRSNPHVHTVGPGGAHSHNVSVVYGGTGGTNQGIEFIDRVHNGTVNGAAQAVGDHSHGLSASDINHEHAISSTGESGTDKNMQPYLVLNYIIKATSLLASSGVGGSGTSGSGSGSTVAGTETRSKLG